MFGRSKPEPSSEPDAFVAAEIFEVTELDIIPAREVVPEAFIDLEVGVDKTSPLSFTGDERLIAALTDLFARSGVRYATAHVELSVSPGAFVVRCLWDDEHAEVQAGVTLVQAMFRMAQHIVDGGVCVHCRKVTGVARDFEDDLDPELACWYQMDPELGRFRRTCEGDSDD